MVAMRNDARRIEVLVIIQAALLDEITPRMQYIAVSWSNISMTIRVVFDSPEEAFDTLIVSEIETEIYSHCSESESIIVTSEWRGNEPLSLDLNEELVYLRRREL
jgi:hypothetical protein